MSKSNIMWCTTITLMVFAGAVAFYSCQKDNELLTKNDKAKITKSSGVLENPFEQAGVLHNECIKYIASIGNTVDLTNNDLWSSYGVPFYRNVLGADYIDIPLATLNTFYEKATQIVENKYFLSVLDELVDANRINPDYVVPNGGRNNYEILEDYFTFLTNYTVGSEVTYGFAYTKLCNIEQEILTNYYNLLENSSSNYRGSFIEAPSI